MNTATHSTSFSSMEKSQKAGLSLAAIVAAVLMVDLRESLAATSAADKSDAGFAYGL
jgi:hypothetical protein